MVLTRLKMSLTGFHYMKNGFYQMKFGRSVAIGSSGSGLVRLGFTELQRVWWSLNKPMAVPSEC